MKTNQPKVSVIILNWNGVEDTIECLESLKKITYPNYEIIVVDNASSGDDVKILKKRFGKYIKMIQNDKNEGFAEGNNVAMRQVLKENKSKYVLLLNNDTVVDKKFLDELVNALEANLDIGIAMPLIKNKDGSIQTAGNYFSFYGGVRLSKVINQKIKEIGYSSGAATFIRIVDFNSLEGFDKNLFMYAEDLDLGIRAKKVLFKRNCCITPSIIYHLNKSSSNKNGEFWSIYQDTLGRIYVIKKNYHSIEKILRISFFIVYSLFKSLIKLFEFKNNYYRIKGLVNGLKSSGNKVYNLNQNK